jgi:hypothetical protein
MFDQQNNLKQCLMRKLLEKSLDQKTRFETLFPNKTFDQTMFCPKNALIKHV